MAYDADIYRAIESEYEALRRENEQNLFERRALVFSRVPEIEAIDKEIKNLGLKLYSIALSGGDVKTKVSSLREEQKKLLAERTKLLLKNGFLKDELSERFHCKMCHDTGSIGTAPCECYKKMLILKSYEQSNLSTQLVDQSFETFDLNLYSDEKDAGVNGASPREYMRGVLERCKEYVKSFETTKDNLIFMGPPGLGKTFLSTCIAKELLKKGYSVIYETAYRTFSMLEELKFKRTEDTEKLKVKADKLYECDLLILDDLGSEFSSQYTTAALFDIINSRLITGKKTVINTNLTMSEIEKKYTERVASRIMGHFLAVQFIGSDLRQIRSVNL